MAKRTLNQDVTGRGLNQGDLVLLLENLVDLINEIQDDHATISPTGSPSSASAITDTSGSSVPATLTNATNLVLTGG